MARVRASWRKKPSNHEKTKVGAESDSLDNSYSKNKATTISTPQHEPDSVVSQASLTGLLTVKANQYVTGTKLMIIIAGVSLAVLLMLVGTMIISMV